MAPILVAAVDLTFFGLDDLAEIEFTQGSKPVEQKIFKPPFVLVRPNCQPDPLVHILILPQKSGTQPLVDHAPNIGLENVRIRFPSSPLRGECRR